MVSKQQSASLQQSIFFFFNFTKFFLISFATVILLDDAQDSYVIVEKNVDHTWTSFLLIIR